jgi:hypothetical protein
VQGIRDTVELCERVAGGVAPLRERPIVSFITSWMVSPLLFATDVTTLWPTFIVCLSTTRRA